MRNITLLLVWLIGTNLSAQENVPREFRGVWIATVENIDWPSQRGLSPKLQQSEFTALLDRLKMTGINSVVVQIRPSTDAFYPSPLEPWSIYLNGEMDQAPSPYYDPLQFMIKEAHKRSMEFHAWLNPYRALNHSDVSILSPNHPMKQHPNWFVQYGDKHYFDPGIPESKGHILQVIKNLVTRYDLDAIHFDDYFYPYKIAGKEFPDEQSYREFAEVGQSKDDWRRDNVNQLIKEIHHLLEVNSPRVQLGISPFGVWRNRDKDPNRGSPTRAGQTCYDDLYADVLLWIENGWVDYIVPQLYFPIGFDLIDPEIMMRWWAEHVGEAQLYIGKGLYRVGSTRDERWMNPSEIPNQVKLSRSIPQIKGSVYFSAKWFDKNPLNVIETLSKELYKNLALPPARNVGQKLRPEKPYVEQVKRKKGYTQIEWSSPYGPKPFYYLIYRFSGKQPGNLSDVSKIVKVTSFNPNQFVYFDQKGRKGQYYTYVIVPYSRDHNEGQPSNPITAKFR